MSRLLALAFLCIAAADFIHYPTQLTSVGGRRPQLNSSLVMLGSSPFHCWQAARHPPTFAKDGSSSWWQSPVPVAGSFIYALEGTKHISFLLQHHGQASVVEEWSCYPKAILEHADDGKFDDASKIDCPRDCITCVGFGNTRCSILNLDKAECVNDTRCVPEEARMELPYDLGASPVGDGGLVGCLGSNGDADTVTPVEGDCSARQEYSQERMEDTLWEVSTRFSLQDPNGWHYMLAQRGLVFFKKIINDSRFECVFVDQLEKEPQDQKLGLWNKVMIPGTEKAIIQPAEVWQNETFFKVHDKETHLFYVCTPVQSDDESSCHSSCFDGAKLRKECYTNLRCIPDGAYFEPTKVTGQFSQDERCFVVTKDGRVELQTCDGSDRQKWTFATWNKTSSSQSLVI